MEAIPKLCVFAVLSLCFLAPTQSNNLLQNPNAEQGKESWTGFGAATVETTAEGFPCFVLRDGGHFMQDVSIPDDRAGQFVVLVGRGSSEAAADNSPMDQPWIVGYMLNSADPVADHYYAYLQGQTLHGTARTANEWTNLYGVFRIVPGTNRIRILLQQSRRENARPKSTTRFRDIGLYVFTTQQEAREFLVANKIADDRRIARLAEAGSQSVCAEVNAREISLLGVKTGMTVDDALALFPGSIRDPEVTSFLVPYKAAGSKGLLRLLIKPNKYLPGADDDGIVDCYLQALNGRVFEIRVSYRQPIWKNVDQFIESASKTMRLPAPSSWSALPATSQFSKYILCDGVEVKFYASPARQLSSSGNLITITDTLAAKASTP